MAAPVAPPPDRAAAGGTEFEDTAVLPEGDPSGIGGATHARKARSRRAMRVAVILCVALATGQFMQSYGQAATTRAAAAEPPQQTALGATQVAAVVLTPVRFPVTPASQLEDRASDTLLDSQTALLMPGGGPARAADTAARCGASLKVTAAPDAMLGLALSAPCHGGERLVLHHAGLSVTGKLDAAGHLAMELPALARDGAVTVSFPDGDVLRAAAAVPELVKLRRVALEWRSGNRLTLHGLKSGAKIGAAGDVSDAQPGAPAGPGGWLVRLGASGVAKPMMAEVFTYPADSSAPVDAAVVARVTPDNCGRQMRAETIASVGGKPRITGLTLAMPACGSASGYVVLHNLLGEMRVATSD